MSINIYTSNMVNSTLKNFKHEYNINAYIKHTNVGTVMSGRFLELDGWLKEHIVDYAMGWWEGGQYGYWALGVNNPEDFVAFKLRFEPLNELPLL